MRGNRLARGGDPMKTRSEKRRNKKEKVNKTARVQRLKKRLGRIVAKKCAVQQDGHTTALMESFVLRRKAERAEEKETTAAAEAAAEKAELEAEEGYEEKVSEEEEDDGDDENFPDESPRARHKRMKDRKKGIFAEPPRKPGSAAVTPSAPKKDARSQQRNHHHRQQQQQRPKDNAAKKAPRYDPKNRRVETRSLY